MVRAADEPAADDSILHTAGLLAEAVRDKNDMTQAARELPAPLCAYYNSINGGRKTITDRISVFDKKA